ncbi:hypothetical protein Dda3937_04557 [Dickeya dadantii 3937]|uniref:Uncharacterized protein n=1 Tax=Dickeya dadantii (strain 3937) TaxID=198628 RepID=E0SM31_DICD3|nr:hypothetical protein Dda3937_04557 [Dickeya dadantii 3937]
MNSFVRDKRCNFFAASLHARQGEVQTPPLLDHWLVAKQWRCALPSAFAFAVRAARDVLLARHGLSPRIWTLPHLQSVFFKTAWQVVQSYIRFFAFVAPP